MFKSSSPTIPSIVKLFSLSCCKLSLNAFFNPTLRLFSSKAVTSLSFCTMITRLPSYHLLTTQEPLNPLNCSRSDKSNIRCIGLIAGLHVASSLLARSKSGFNSEVMYSLISLIAMVDGSLEGESHVDVSRPVCAVFGLG